MDLSKLDDDQIKVALKVIESAKKHGINPDFVLPMVNQESQFRPNAKSPAGAIGPMQLMPSTAKEMGVDPSNLDENIDGGMRFLKGLVENKKLGGDPNAVIAAYNAGPNAKFFQTGNLADLPDETVKHVIKITSNFGDTVPSMTIQSQEPEVSAQPDAESTGTEEQYQGNPIANAPSEAEKNRSAIEAGAMGAGVGTLGGSIYTAKAPIFRMAQRVGLLPGGKPIAPAEAAALAERVMTPPGEPVESVVRKPHGGENWQKSLTGISTPGAQMDKASLDLAKRMQGAVGIEGAPGFTGGTITQGGVILSPQDAAAVKARADAAAAQAAQREAQFQSLVRQAGQSDALQRGARTILGSAPVRGGLAGFGAAYNAQEAYNRFDEGDPLAGTLSAGAAGASGLSLVPRLAARAVPAAVGLTAASDVVSKLRRGDRQGAAESGLTGLAAVAPRVFGPAATAVYSRSLGPDEMAELERRRKMRPTITP